MRQIIRQWTVSTEFLVVMGLAFGYFIFSSLLWVMYYFSPGATESPFSLTDADLYLIITYEVIIGGIIVSILFCRGWQWRDLNLSVSIMASLAGLLLYLFYFSFYFLVHSVAVTVFESQTNTLIESGIAELSLPVILLISVINPVFEESLVVAYVFRTLESRKGIWFAINISVLIRLLYHLYQGPFAVLSILPMGILFAYVYARYRKIWPLIVAHAIMDVVGLMSINV